MPYLKLIELLLKPPINHLTSISQFPNQLLTNQFPTTKSPSPAPLPHSPRSNLMRYQFDNSLPSSGHTSPPQTPPAAHIAKTHTDAARYRVEGRARCSSRRRGLLVAELRMKMRIRTAKMEKMGSAVGGGLAGSSEGLDRGWGGMGRGRLCRGIWLCRFCRWC